MNTLKTLGLAALVALIVVSVAFWLVGSQSGQSFGADIGITAYPHSGLAARFIEVSTSTNPQVITDGTLSIGGGSVTILRSCVTSTWNPSAVSSTTLASTSVYLPNALLGDDIGGTITTSTQGLLLKASLLTNTTATIVLSAPSGLVGSIDIATTTLEVCDTR